MSEVYIFKITGFKEVQLTNSWFQPLFWKKNSVYNQIIEDVLFILLVTGILFGMLEGQEHRD